MPVWVAHRNGQIPLSALEYVGIGVRSGQPQYLHPTVAEAWRNLQAAFRGGWRVLRPFAREPSQPEHSIPGRGRKLWCFDSAPGRERRRQRVRCRLDRREPLWRVLGLGALMPTRPIAGNPRISCDHGCHRRRTPPSGGTDYAVPVGTHVIAPVSVTCLPVPVELLEAVRFRNEAAGIDTRHIVRRVGLQLRADGLMTLDLQEVIDLETS